MTFWFTVGVCKAYLRLFRCYSLHRAAHARATASCQAPLDLTPLHTGIWYIVCSSEARDWNSGLANWVEDGIQTELEEAFASGLGLVGLA